MKKSATKTQRHEGTQRNPLSEPLCLCAFVAMLSIFIFGCEGNNNSDKKNKNESNAKTYSFERYISSIRTVPLPFKDTCFNTLGVQALKMPDSLLRTYSGLPRIPQILGKIAETDDYVVVLYSLPADVQLPVLKTFSKEGKKISSLPLYIGKCCGEEEDCIGLSSVLITKDLHIILKDSMQVFERSKKKYQKKKHTKTSVRTVKYRIDENGKIVKAL